MGASNSKNSPTPVRKAPDKPSTKSSGVSSLLCYVNIVLTSSRHHCTTMTKYFCSYYIYSCLSSSSSSKPSSNSSLNPNSHKMMNGSQMKMNHLFLRQLVMALQPMCYMILKVCYLVLGVYEAMAHEQHMLDPCDLTVLVVNIPSLIC